jgi:hypothetical protein
VVIDVTFSGNKNVIKKPRIFENIKTLQ